MTNPPDTNRALVEALERIVEVGTRTETVRVGDAWSPDGWQDNEVVSEEAEIALQALASISSLEEGVTSGDGGWSQVKRWFGEDVSALSVPGRTEEGQRIIVRFRDGRHITVFAETADRAWAKLRAVAFAAAPATQAEREAVERLRSDTDYITAALSWYDGGPAGPDVQQAWTRLLSLLESRP